MRLIPPYEKRCIGIGLWFCRRRHAALLLQSLEPILETAQCFLLLSQLHFGGCAALLELEQILCLVPIELRLK